MAGTLLHIAIADAILGRAKLDHSTELACKHHRDEYYLGAVLVDLPYYDKLIVSAVKSLAGIDINYHVWGNLLHLRAPSQLALAFLERATDPKKRALAFGYLTHMAVDLVFHREIHQRVMQQADGERHLDGIHKQIEDQIDLHVFYALLGHSGTGTPYAAKKMNLNLDDSWIQTTIDAIKDIHGNAPDPDELRQWQQNMALFGRFSQAAFFPWVCTALKDDPALEKRSLELLEEAIELALEFFDVASGHLKGIISRQTFLDKIPDRSMADGELASPLRS